jgi:uncharacterized repeat protein (TIGR03803 family)
MLTVGVCQGQTVTDIANFTGQSYWTYCGHTLIQGRNGKLFGSCEGTAGSFFDLSASGGLSLIYEFTASSNAPASTPTLATDGNFYGTAGGGTANFGVLYKVTPAGAYAVLHNFLGGSDGSGPIAAPIEASDGTLYGTTSGTTGNPATVYQYTRSGTFTTLYVLDDIHGTRVDAGLLQGSDGNLYGTAIEGGSKNNGTVFKLTISGKLLNYYSFPGGSGGALPYATLIQASDGYFYGTTYQGGYTPGPGWGTVFRMDRNLSVFILYSLNPFTDGVRPSAGVVQGTDGNLYGTLSYGGANNFGALFQITTSGAYNQLYSFSSSVGENPIAALTQDTGGLFYSTAAQFGGAYGYGSAFSLDMGLGPFITFVSATGKVGQSAQILGQNLKGTTSVTFNGVPATSFSVKSNTYMTAVIPSGATTGPVVVTTPTGPLTSNKNFAIHK